MTHPRDERHWYAIYTRPNFEKRIHAELTERGLISFLPLRSTIRLWSDRKKRIEAPLFPSYLFVHANLKERYESLQTRGAVRMVSFNGEPARIPEYQIESIRRILEHGYDPEPFQYLSAGDEVEIVAGPLLGVRGYCVEARGRHQLVISLAAIRQSVAVTVERGQVKKVRSATAVKQREVSTWRRRLELV